MLGTWPSILFNLFCTLYQCQWNLNTPYLVTNPNDNPQFSRSRHLPFDTRFQARSSVSDDGNPLVSTKLGIVQGFKMKIAPTREIFAFTGVPFGESTGGENRFRDPVPKKPWSDIWDATFPSPACLQTNPSSATAEKIIGQEDCLHLDIYTPSLPKNNGNASRLLPVFMFVPGGFFMYGNSRAYGPKYLLREQVIFIPINVRKGIFGYLSTGDEHGSGNWALKDMALAIEWVHDNIAAFGGDPNRITLGGISSGAASSHLMLFTNHRARNYIKGILCMSGTSLMGTLDVLKSVQNLSNSAAEAVGCPTSVGAGGSKGMMECLRKIPPFDLASFHRSAHLQFPIALFVPTLEKPGPSAFISEPPEVQYRKGIVPPIPLIMSRAEDEVSMGMFPFRYSTLPLSRPLYSYWMPLLLHLGYRNTFQNVNARAAQKSLTKLHQFYFRKSGLPNFMVGPDYLTFCQMLSDSLFNIPMWKAIKYHHQVAPTYAYIQKINTLAASPILSPVMGMLRRQGISGATHGGDGLLLFNASQIAQPITPGSDMDIASRRFINMIVNFATYGKPLYRNGQGMLLSVWKPVVELRKPVALEVGLVHGINMIMDPVATPKRLRIWDQVVF
ncbi:unnamed protein product [Orchesella dallaii]|uniref:Carboxylic ester hydrolase n=1 Tax=Orchesella dallaii TaxID=48710 RepID=A0ABP1RS98_9HEXA